MKKQGEDLLYVPLAFALFEILLVCILHSVSIYNNMIWQAVPFLLLSIFFLLGSKNNGFGKPRFTFATISIVSVVFMLIITLDNISGLLSGCAISTSSNVGLLWGGDFGSEIYWILELARSPYGMPETNRSMIEIINQIIAYIPYAWLFILALRRFITGLKRTGGSKQEDVEVQKRTV